MRPTRLNLGSPTQTAEWYCHWTTIQMTSQGGYHGAPYNPQQRGRNAFTTQIAPPTEGGITTDLLDNAIRMICPAPDR